MNNPIGRPEDMDQLYRLNHAANAMQNLKIEELEKALAALTLRVEELEKKN